MEVQQDHVTHFTVQNLPLLAFVLSSDDDKSLSLGETFLYVSWDFIDDHASELFVFALDL